MQEFISQFHFLRPWWLLAALPAIGIVVLLWRQGGQLSQWRQVIAPDMLRYLLDRHAQPGSRWPLVGLLSGWLLASVALAGPSWERLPQPVQKLESGVVVLWDMSPSMMAEDLKPSRLVRARYKLIDFLRERAEGLTGLVAYAGEAHIISPLTDDANTITNLLPALEPGIMPLQGSNVEMAVQLGIQLLQDAGLREGELLLVTDGVDISAHAQVIEQIGASPFQLSILGVGSDEGAPIPTGEAGFAKNADNAVVIARLGSPELRTLAARTGGTYVTLSADNRDIDHLLGRLETLATNASQARQVERDFDRWLDAGQYLVLLLLPLAALAFRRGWLAGLALFGLLHTEPSYAFEWQDLWLRSDQQAQQALEADQAEIAAQKAKSPEWKGTAHYRGENYQQAAESFAELDDPEAHYNRGNALAKAGELQAALDAYEAALEGNPDLEDAHHNAEIVRKLLEQQQQQNAQNQNSDDQQHGDEQKDNNEQANADSQQQSQEQPQQQSSSGQQSDDQQAQNQQSGQPQEQQSQEQQSQEQSQAQQNAQQNGESEEGAQELAARDGERQDPEKQERAAEQLKAQQNSEQDGEQQEPQSMVEGLAENETSSEEQQALEQWLRQIPDDPAGLLRRKMEYQHLQLRQRYRTGQWEPPANDAYNRW